MTARAPADQHGVWLPAAEDAPVDLLIDGRRVWSFNPARDAVRQDGMFLVRWPAELVPYLDGAGQIAVREHLTGRVLFDEPVRLGTGTARLRIADPSGQPLVVGKFGWLEQDFGGYDRAAAQALVRTVAELMALIRDAAGVETFLAYGALLGAVRNGRLIGHDGDVDVAFLAGSPVDAARTSFRIERVLRGANCTVQRYSAGTVKVRFGEAGGPKQAVDVFAAFPAGGRYYMMPFVSAPARQLRLLPLAEVELEGVRLPAPADPASLLEATYGPGWRVPDPAFQYRVPAATRRRLTGWMRQGLADRRYWTKALGDDEPAAPSDFAAWFAGREPGAARVVDIGCGAGQDALWLAECGHRVLGLDYARKAVDRARDAALERAVDARFHQFNLYDARHVLALGGLLSHETGPTHLYSRSLLDALDEGGRRHLWLLARMCLRRGGRLYLEFPIGSVPNSRRNQALDPDDVTAEIRAAGGDVKHREMAHRAGGQPATCRMVASW